MIIITIPLCKLAEALAQGYPGREAEVALEGGTVGIGDGDVAGLHGDELFVGLEVVVGGKYAGADEFFLEDGDEVEQVLGLATANVVNFIWWDREPILADGFLWGMLHYANDAFDDIIDKGEVAAAVAIIEYLNVLATDEFVGEPKVGHIGSAGRAIDREETETRGGNVVEFAIGMGQKFVALLGGGIKRDGIVNAVVGAEGNLLVSAIDTGTGGIDEVLHGIVAAGLKDVVESDDIALDVGVGVLDAVTYTRLGGEVDNDVGLMLFEDLANEVAVGDVAFYELIAGSRRLAFLLNLAKAIFLETDVVVVVHVVDTDDVGFGPVAEEATYEVAANEAGTAGN